MNLQVREFEQDIIRIINQSPLPIEVKRLVMKDLFFQVSKMADEAVVLETNIKKEQEIKNEEVTE